jgi:hypothetical protein
MDLAGLDRDIAAIAHADAASIDWESYRHVSGQRALRELEGVVPEPFREALVQWISWLTVVRVEERAARTLAHLRATTRVAVRLRRDVEMTEPELLRGMLGSKSAREASEHFAAWRDIHEAFRAAEHTLRETRKEAFHRLGIDDVPLRFVAVPRAELVASAERFLVDTRDLSLANRKEDGWPLDLAARLGHAATEGWPSKLNWRTTALLVPGMSMRAVTQRPDLGECPSAFGGMSFARALAMLGAAFRRTAFAESVPFVLREGPLSVDVHQTAMLFAGITAERAFHARVLGLAPGRACDQARVLGASLLEHARLLALRVALSGAGDTEALSVLALGTSVPGWPATRDDDAGRFVALTTVLERVDTLRAREGDDWFRNPRAFGTLRDLLQTTVASGADVSALTRRFEKLLG